MKASCEAVFKLRDTTYCSKSSMKVIGDSSSVYPEKVGGLISISGARSCCAGTVISVSVSVSESLFSANSSRVNCCRASMIGVAGSDSVSGFQGAYSSSYQLLLVVSVFSGVSRVGCKLKGELFVVQPKGEVLVLLSTSQWAPNVTWGSVYQSYF